MAQLVQVERHAVEDIDRIEESDPDAAAEIVVVLQELNNQPTRKDDLTEHGFADGRIDVSMVAGLQRAGFNLWRLKCDCLDTDDAASAWHKYRILYAFNRVSHRFHVLAVVPRDKTTYDKGDPITQRVLGDYARLGIPPVPYAR